jgi:hypothetical protein
LKKQFYMKQWPQAAGGRLAGSYAAVLEPPGGDNTLYSSQTNPAFERNRWRV